MIKPLRKTPSIDDLRLYLKRNDLKSTKQRLAVHKAMLTLGHACADMVTEEIQKDSSVKVTVASVYNILTQMSDIGVYSRRMSANNKMYFDVNNFQHIHLYDRINNTYKDIIDDGFIGLVNEFLAKRKFKGYKVEDIDIQIVCRPSRAAKDNASKDAVKASSNR